MIDIGKCDADKCRREIESGRNIIRMLKHNQTIRQMFAEMDDNTTDIIATVEAGVAEYEARLKELTNENPG